MIDVHCHILPALDDGAVDLDDALAMARQAEADGIAAICATPHIRHDHDVVIAEIAGRVAELNAALARARIRTTVRTGAEVAETAVAGLEGDDLRLASLGGGGRWILLEPAPGPLGASLDAAVEELARRGYRSVIAHPERHADGQLRPRLAGLVRLGALIQVTAELLAHEHAAPVIAELAREGLVHLLGSDSHSSRAGRPVRLSEGFDALRRSEPFGGAVEWMARVAPAAILRGEDVEAPLSPA